MAFKNFISCATYLAAKFGCNRFRIIPDIVSMLLCASICSDCAVSLESEQTPFLKKVVTVDFGSAALHRIQFGT